MLGSRGDYQASAEAIENDDAATKSIKPMV
jgi:hypothetical protein